MDQYNCWSPATLCNRFGPGRYGLRNSRFNNNKKILHRDSKKGERERETERAHCLYKWVIVIGLTQRHPCRYNHLLNV